MKQQVEDGRFSAAGWTDQRHTLARLRLEADVFESWRARSRVPEADAFELDMPGQPAWMYPDAGGLQFLSQNRLSPLPERNHTETRDRFAEADNAGKEC